jgi:hypothetical protein
MELFEIVPHLLIGTRLAAGSEYATLGVDVIIDLEDWEWAWVPPVPTGKMFLSFPMEDEETVDPPRPATSHSSLPRWSVRGRRCSCTAPRDSTGQASSPLVR